MTPFAPDPWGRVHEHWSDTDRLNVKNGSNLLSAEEGFQSQWGERPPAIRAEVEEMRGKARHREIPPAPLRRPPRRPARRSGHATNSRECRNTR